MPHDKRRTRKLRGSRTYGWGQVGQHRGSGMRGGYGRAGVKGHMFMKYAYPLQKKKGFVKKPLQSEGSTINVGELERFMEREKEEKVVLDMASAGYGKLLGAGHAPRNIEVVIPSWSKRAEEKLLAAGSTIRKSS